MYQFCRILTDNPFIMGGSQSAEKTRSATSANTLQTQSSAQNYPSECPMHKSEAAPQSFPSECPMHQKTTPSPPSGCPMHEGGAKEEEIDPRNMVRYSCSCFSLYQIFSVIFSHRCIKVLSLNTTCNCVIVLSFTTCITCIFIYSQHIRAFNVGRHDAIFFTILKKKIYLLQIS